MWLTPVVLVTALIFFAFAHLALRAKYPKDQTTLIDAIDELLPQTQCAQCGFPGCRPYARAIAEGEALNLCPPGGADVYRTLLDLMDVPAGAQGALLPPEELPPDELPPAVADIDESQCIGCSLCLAPCPVDAIVGTANKMHTVITEQCTGCELCIPACPVDCITLHPVQPPPTFGQPCTDIGANRSTRACINCGLCNPVCPVGLPVQELLHTVQHQNVELAATKGLAECIECGLCDRACPSHIAMAALFSSGKHRWFDEQWASSERLRLKTRFSTHTERHARQQANAADKRTERLGRVARWS